MLTAHPAHSNWLHVSEFRYHHHPIGTLNAEALPTISAVMHATHNQSELPLTVTAILSKVRRDPHRWFFRHKTDCILLHFLHFNGFLHFVLFSVFQFQKFFCWLSLPILLSHHFQLDESVQ